MNQATNHIQSLYERGDYDALAEHLKCKRSAGNRHDVDVWAALLAYRQGDYHAAYRAALMAISHNSALARPYALLGRIGEALAMSSLAIYGYQQAVRLEPLNNDYREMLARCYREQGNVAMANRVQALLTEPAAIVVPEGIDHAATEALPPNSVVVVVPVYDDVGTTRACLHRLLVSVADNTTPMHILVINDASPDVVLQEYLRTLPVELIEHTHNLGFIHTANQGLRRYPDHDVVLLNADALVHGSWLDRLRAVADSQPKVASVTPFSNYGELVSFPLPDQRNPLPDHAQVDLLDALAAQLGQSAVEIPVGVGFCFYLKRKALNAVGLLNDTDYVRGYGEEADLCLRFKLAGWTNSCATNVYVGHVGGRSFGLEKQVRAAQNNQLLERRYPRYRQSYELFTQQGHLRPARAALEWAWLHQAASDICVLYADRQWRHDRRVQALRFQVAEAGKALYVAVPHDGACHRLQVASQQGAANITVPKEELEVWAAQCAEIYYQTKLPPVEVPILPALPQHQHKVVAVWLASASMAELRALRRVARCLAEHHSEILLWLQQRTLIDEELVATGVVALASRVEALGQQAHLLAGGATAIWQVDERDCYDAPKAIEALINEW